MNKKRCALSRATAHCSSFPAVQAHESAGVRYGISYRNDSRQAATSELLPEIPHPKKLLTYIKLEEHKRKLAEGAKMTTRVSGRSACFNAPHYLDVNYN